MALAHFHGIGPVVNPTDADYEKAAWTCSMQAIHAEPADRVKWWDLHEAYVRVLKKRQWMPSKLRQMADAAP